MQSHTKALACRLDRAGDLDIGIARRRVAGRMVADHHKCARIEFEGTLDDFAWIDGRLIDCASALKFGGDQTILAVQKQQMKALARQVPDGRTAIIQNLVLGIEDLAFLQIFAGLANADLMHGLNQAGHCGSRALLLDDVRTISGQHAGQAAKPCNQTFGQRFGVASEDGAEQCEFEEFIVRHRRAVVGCKPVAQPGAVVLLIFGRGHGSVGVSRRAVYPSPWASR